MNFKEKPKNMDRELIIVICILVILIIVGIVVLNSQKGNISNVNIILKESEIYSKDDIDDAIDVTLKYFKENFKGCSLLEITYVGDEKNNDYFDWANRNNKEEVIVLISNFETNSFCSDTLNPNSEYKGWNWILVRNKNENWKHIDHGY